MSNFFSSAMNETQMYTITLNPTAAFVIGTIVGFAIGGVIGYMIAARSHKADMDVSAIQLLAFLVLFCYVGLSFIFGREPSWLIAIGILSVGYGARGGMILERILEVKK